MSLRLILTRHAKSSWDNPLQKDFDRPLNPRGRASVAALGAWMARNSYFPDLVLLSASRRTRETWSGIAQFLDTEPEIHSTNDLYLADPATMLSALRSVTVRCVMIIAHNPGLGAFARRISRLPHPHPRFSDYPTGATTVLRFDFASWSSIGWASGEITDFAIPRELPTP